MPTSILTTALLTSLLTSLLTGTLAVTTATVGAAQDAAGDGADEGAAFITMTATRATVHVGEPIELTVRFGMDTAFLNEQAVPLFRRPLDVPVQIAAPALAALPGTLPLPPLDDGDAGVGADTDSLPDGTSRLSFALNDDAVTAAATIETRHDRAYTVLTITRRLVAESPGELVLPAPTLRYAYATDFREDFINERVPIDRRETRLTGAPLTLEVLALPEQGRPFDFGGAVGNFTLSARVSPLEVELGKTIELVLVIEGTGNLPWFAPPALEDLDAFDGFHLIDSIHAQEGRRLTIGYELMPHRVLTEVPAIPFSFFEPGPEPGYRTLTTKPVPLTVRAGPDPR
jgi:hypothetical protein